LRAGQQKEQGCGKQDSFEEIDHALRVNFGPPFNKRKTIS